MNNILPFPTPWKLPWEEQLTGDVVTSMIARCGDLTVVVRRDDNRLLRFDFSVCDSAAGTINYEHAFIPREPILSAMGVAFHSPGELDERIQERAMHAFELLLAASNAARLKYRPTLST